MVDETGKVLIASLTTVRRVVGGPNVPDTLLWGPTKDLVELIRQYIHELRRPIYPISTKLNVNQRADKQRLHHMLQLGQSIIIDAQGTAIMHTVGVRETIGTETSIMELVRSYTMIRQELKEKSIVILPHPRECSILKLHASEDPFTIFMDLGAVGSFIEEPRLGMTFPAVGYFRRNNLDLARKCVKSLPPLYNRLGITVGII